MGKQFAVGQVWLDQFGDEWKIVEIARGYDAHYPVIASGDVGVRSFTQDGKQYKNAIKDSGYILTMLLDRKAKNAPASRLLDRVENRKAYPMKTGLLDYFPDALAMIAHCSFVANEQHNPGEPVHWDREKSADHGDCALRHFSQAGTIDADGIPHTAKAAWRLLAMLQIELERERNPE